MSRFIRSPFSLFRLFMWMTVAITVVNLTACTPKPAEHKITGETMGTTYSVIYIAAPEVRLMDEIALILEEVNLSLSTYIDTSTISLINQTSIESGIAHGLSIYGNDDHFQNVYQNSVTCFKETNGAFNPAVMPLVNYYGFGPSDGTGMIDSATVDSLVAITNFQRLLDYQDGTMSMILADPIQLDFSAIAKGYGVDQIAEMLLEKDVDDFLIEIGGEIRTSGKSASNSKWAVGIQNPQSTELAQTVYLGNLSMATSGNYHNHHVIDGKKVVHTINPGTGYPEISNLLSATVFHPDCASADALATGSMVMGVENAKAMAEGNSEIGLFLIYSTPENEIATYMSPGLDSLFAN